MNKQKLCDFCNRISLILQALGCAVMYFLIEAMSRHSFTEAWNFMVNKPLVFAYNAGFIFTTMLISYLFSGEHLSAYSGCSSESQTVFFL